MWHFTLAAVLVLVALDGTAALAASALLRAAAARAAREWSYDRHAQTMPAAAAGPARADIRRPGRDRAVATGESGLTAQQRWRGCWRDRRPRDGRFGGRAQGERGDQHRVRASRSRSGPRSPARRCRVRRPRRAAHRCGVLPGVWRDADRPHATGAGRGDVLGARPPAGRMGSHRPGNDAAQIAARQAVALVFFESRRRSRSPTRKPRCTPGMGAMGCCWAPGVWGRRSAASCSRARSGAPWASC